MVEIIINIVALIGGFCVGMLYAGRDRECQKYKSTLTQESLDEAYEKIKEFKAESEKKISPNLFEDDYVRCWYCGEINRLPHECPDMPISRKG